MMLFVPQIIYSDGECIQTINIGVVPTLAAAATQIARYREENLYENGSEWGGIECFHLYDTESFAEFTVFFREEANEWFVRSTKTTKMVMLPIDKLYVWRTNPRNLDDEIARYCAMVGDAT